MKKVCNSCGKSKQGFVLLTLLPGLSMDIGGHPVTTKHESTVVLCNECLWKLYHQTLVKVMSSPAFALRYSAVVGETK